MRILKKKWFRISGSATLALLIVASALFGISQNVVLSADPLPIEKVSDPAKQVKELSTRSILLAQGIDPDYVELTQDYALSTTKDDGKSPYTKTYTDLVSNKKIVEISQLPMVNANGERLDTTWVTKEGKNFSAGINQFTASVAENKVTIVAINDQPDGKVKKDNVLTFQPQLYLNEKEVKPLSNTPTLLATDPVNSNYINNTLVWDYGIAKRHLRLIEGSIFGSWIFTSNPGGEVRIKYNQSGDYKLRLGQFQISADEEMLPTTAFESPMFGYPFTVSDSATFYPDASPETSSVDGRLQYGNDPSDFGTLYAATDANSGDDTTDYLNTYIYSSTTSNKWVTIYRSFLLFDTSSLPDAAVISAVTASLYGYATYGANFGSTLNWYSSNPASNVAIVFADFDQVGTTAFATAIAASNCNVGTPGTSTDWTFNAAGIAAISKTGVTKLSFRENHDAANSAPTWESAKYGGFIPWSSDKGNGYKPKLVVTYTLIATPTVTTQAAINVEETTATGNGNITATGGENASSVRFEYDTDSGAPYANTESSAGSYGAGAFTLSLTGLTKGELYYGRAGATNSAGTGYGSEVTFLTKPDAPANLTSPSYGTNSIFIEWDKGTGAGSTIIRYRSDGSYPANPTDGSSAYSGVGSSTNVTGLDVNTEYKFRGWSYVTEGSLEQYSDVYVSLTASTDYIRPPSDFIPELTSLSAVHLTWVTGINADETVIVANTDHQPTDLTDGDIIYSGNLTSYDHLGVTADVFSLYYSAWGKLGADYSTDYVETNIGGETMALIAIIILVMGMTLFAYMRTSLATASISALLWLFFWAYTRNNPIPGTTTGDFADSIIYYSSFLAMIAVFFIWLSRRKRNSENTRTPKEQAEYDKEYNEAKVPLLDNNETYRQRVRKALQPRRNRK